MNLKKVFRSVWDHTLELQERRFRLFVLIGLTGLAAGFAVSAVSDKSRVNVISLCIAFGVFAGIAWLAIHYHKIHTGAVIIAAIIIYFLAPFNFVTAGGIYGGAPIWFLLGVVYVCLVVQGKIKYVFLISSFVIISPIAIQR